MFYLKRDGEGGENGKDAGQAIEIAYGLAFWVQDKAVGFQQLLQVVLVAHAAGRLASLHFAGIAAKVQPGGILGLRR